MDTIPMADLAKAGVPFLASFHEVNGQTLKAVWETSAYGATEALHLEFESGFLTFEVDVDDDTVDISLHQSQRVASIAVSNLEPWMSFIGKPFGWGWIAINQQSYMDAVMLSFGAVTPQICITAVASRLNLSRLEEIASHTLRQLEPASEYA